MDRPIVVVANLTAACALFAFIGAIYSTGVFNSAVDDALSPKSPLRGRIASAMGPLSLLTALIMPLSAIVLDHGAPAAHAKSRRVKVLSAVGALGFFSFALAAEGIRHDKPSVVTIGVLLLGVPLGVFYFLSTELLAAWMPPTRRGIAVGFGQAAFGLGTIAFSSIFTILVQQLGTTMAISSAGTMLGAPALLATLFLSWPRGSADEAGDDVECISNAESSWTDQTIDSQRVPLQELMLDPPFWLYLLLVFSSQTGFAMVPFFFDMSESFGARGEQAVALFQLSNALGTAARLGGGVVSDAFGDGASSGARKLMVILLAVQTTAFGVLAMTREPSVALFAVSSMILFVAFAGGACACAVLARDLYGTANAGTVYAFAGGLAIGLGESTAAQVVTMTLDSQPFNAGPRKFALAFAILASCSLCGFASAVLVQRSKRAFPLLAAGDAEDSGKYGSVYSCESKQAGNENRPR